MNAPRLRIGPFDAATLPWLILLAFTVAVYAFGLGGQYIPSNGDEMVYAHIARLTVASNQWLPLVSELDQMRNTKPPLLFWQAMAAGNWGQHWTLAALRTPSLVYTLLITGAVAWTVHQITHNTRNACLAACVYLAFFSTFRYGRTFLTSAPETFWLNVPMFWLLWHRLRQTSSANGTSDARIPPAPGADFAGLSLAACVGLGLTLGLGLAYKSFALIAPAATAWWCALLLSDARLSWRAVVQATLRVGLSAALALGVFALWFVLDPDPAAVWKEFVIGENAGKLSDSKGYWHTALSGGGSSIWAQLLAYVQNAGLLAFVVLGLGWTGWRQLRQREQSSRLAPHLWILLAWLAVWLLVFILPSQRSARYVIPAMPALAMLIALSWSRIARGWFLLSLVLAGMALLVLGRIAWVAHDLGIASGTELGAVMMATLVGATAVVAGVWKPGWTRSSTVLACIVVYASFDLTVMPLEGPAGRYGAEAGAKLRHASIAIPNGFNGQFERFQFLLPGNRFAPYDSEGRATASSVAPGDQLKQLLARHDAVAWGQADPAESAPPCLPRCTVLASRWHLKGRHQSGEINFSNLWYPQAWLFRREWLVTLATSP